MAAVSDWTQVRVQNKGVASVSKQLLLWREWQSAGYQKHKKNQKFSEFALFIHQAKILKKDSQKWRFMAAFHAQLWVVLPQMKRRPPHFHLTWIAAQPPPLPSVLSVSGG